MMLFQTFLSPNTSSLVGISEASVLSVIFKVLFILSVLFYVVFAVIVIRQVQIMKNTLITSISPVILLASIFHLLFAIGILVLFLLIL